MKLSNWGKYPLIEADIITARSVQGIREYLDDLGFCISRGLGRCYGDSSLSKNIVSMLKLDRFISFDEEGGVLTCEAGVSLQTILDLFIPRGWFLSVTPGTKFITVGGAIASDVHGKNHHKDGCFSEHLLSIDIMLYNGKIIKCSREENKDLFLATCGGMGLTGIILNASFKLKKIETAYLNQEIIQCKNIDVIMEKFEESKDYTYSVAWIDCLKKGDNTGRSILILGEFAKKEAIPKNPLRIKNKFKLNILFEFPGFFLNKFTVELFNELYYKKNKSAKSIIDYDAFFYPLDSIHNWNRIYGKRGFTQYQFVIPKEASKEGLKKILTKISGRKMGSFLAVLKLFGKSNENPLSFPMEGYTLALDFPISNQVLWFLNELDKIVLDYGGRLYLAKDVRMSKNMFVNSYSQYQKFLEIKNKYDPYKKFQSLQSRRLMF
ncbi:MAG: FAD-binding oxidoreductase [Candidatus Hydrogenedentota bacterium]